MKNIDHYLIKQPSFNDEPKSPALSELNLTAHCIESSSEEEYSVTSAKKHYDHVFMISRDSHLGGSGPPALVSHAEAAQALSLGHLVLPWALVFPAAHGG